MKGWKRLFEQKYKKGAAKANIQDIADKIKKGEINDSAVVGVGKLVKNCEEDITKEFITLTLYYKEEK